MLTDLRAVWGEPVRIYLLADDSELVHSFQSLWPADAVSWTVFSSGKELLDCLFNDPPHVLIASLYSKDLSGLDVIRMVKNENVYRQICSILLIEEKCLVTDDVGDDASFDDFIVLPSQIEELRVRVGLAMRRSTRTLDANPLTRLPGNTSIIHTIQAYVNEKVDFALAYADIDNFKSFNDKYGFSRGDEALLMTARLIVTSVGSIDVQPRFVGHVGGDDFIFILPVDYIEDTCKKLIKAYDAIVPNFYDEEDRKRGAIIAPDRQGVMHAYPLLSISIAVIINKNGRFSHFGEMSYIAGQVKRKAKLTQGSCYVIDRRTH